MVWAELIWGSGRLQRISELVLPRKQHFGEVEACPRARRQAPARRRMQPRELSDLCETRPLATAQRAGTEAKNNGKVVFNGVAELEKQSQTGKGRGSLMKGFWRGGR